MFVGTAPSEESQQTTGEYIKGLYKENIPVHARVYLETLLGKKDPITAEDFTKEELADIEKLLSSKPAKGAVTEYSDYEKVRDLDREGRHSSDWLENLPSVGKTLGRFTYETLPDGRRVIKDTYDFYNTSRSINVQEFEEMGPAEKALAVFKKITANRSMMDPPFVKRAADVLGEAYIGRDGRPVKVEYDPKDLPVKRQDGSPSQGEISDDMFVGTRPEDFPETSPVDTAVSDFISSRSKLVTDPQEFFRVMGQNIEEYHSKPLREDPQKYLTEQLGPGALAGTVGKTAKQLFSSLPSSEAPFVSRLDEFVSSLPGAVQKDQFLNQLKGKFRDYDIGRAQEALADLPGNAKLTPFDLLNRVKRVYDPTTFTTRIDYPKIDDYHAGTDNPFKTKEGFSQKPLGVIHLLQGVNPTTSPDAAKLMAAYEDITNRLPGTTFYSFDKTDRNPVSLAQDIYKIASRAGLSSVEDLGMDVQTVLQNMSQSGSDWSKLISAKTMLGNPGRYRPEEIKEVLNETARITGALPEENVKSLQKIAEEINARRTAKQDYSDLESQYHKSFPYAFAEDLEKANRRLWNEHREGKQQIEGLLEGLQKREGIKARVYRGQHSSLAEDSSTIRDPIAFSRFTEHTTDIPGLGKVDGIYVNELQSDRLDDIRKKGRMGGGPQEDITRLDKLDKQIGEAARQFADYKTAMGFRFMNETDKAKISDFNSKLEGLNTKRNTLLDRIREGEYSLKESFAGMEESPQVIQQLMAKNAVAGAMQLGKRFVAFPGAESAQSQLYEKLPNNLKQVVKDLGPGFELRPITLPKPDTSAGGEGGELTSYAIVWGNEAADRIKKQGVPFKDGGEVSTEDFIKRFSKGEMANDEFIQEMMTGTRPTDLPVKRQEEGVSNNNSTQEMFVGTRPSDFSETSPVDTAVSDFISSRSKLVTDPQEFFRVMGQNIEEYHGKPLREDPEKYLMEQLGPGVLGGIIKPKGGNVVTQDLMESLKSLRPSVLYEGYRPASEADKLIREQMKKEEESGRGISASTKRIFEENKPKAALDDWIQNKLGRYIRTEMGSEDDPVRKLGEEMTEKIRSAYEAGFKRIAKMKDKIAEAKAMGKNTDISEAELADEIDKVENAYRQTSKLPVDQGPYLYPRSRTGRAREKAGFSPYPISKSDAGKEWEGTADALFEVHKAGDLVKQNSPLLFDNPWIAKLDPKEIVYQPKNVDEPAMFTHTIDELENALNPTSGLPQNLLLKPEDMQQLSMDKAFRHVNKINDWRAQQRTAANLEEAQRAAVTFKEYPASPGKLKWQELKAPEYTELPPGFRLEDMDYGTAMLKDPQGNVLTYIDKITGKGSVDPLQQALSFLSKNDLERALKYEGSTMRHCVGKYCDDVFSGQTRVFSLRDSRGEPHITIETIPASKELTQENVEAFLQENPGNITQRLGFDVDDYRYAQKNTFRFNPSTEEFDRFLTTTEGTPEFKQWLKAQPEAVRQVKGKGNKKPNARYIEFGQDFIASKNWSDIQDLDNLDIVPLKPMLLKNAQDSGFNPQVLTMVRDQPYVTKEEFNRIAGLFGGMNKYAAGGEVTDFIKRAA
jgi:hypothetical protein